MSLSRERCYIMKGKKAADATPNASKRKWPEPKGVAGKKKLKKAKSAGLVSVTPPPKVAAVAKGAAVVSSNWQALKKSLPKGVQNVFIPHQTHLFYLPASALCEF